MKNIKSWFIGLSRIGRVSVIATAILGLLFTASAMSPPPDTIQPETVDTVKTAPIITTKIETETESIPFEKETVESDALSKGLTQIQTEGVNGKRTITYTVTLTDGEETDRTSTEKITLKPINEVTVMGTYVEPAPVQSASNCDPNYSGCVPIAYDVDCGGGSGNGPEYVYGAVQVIGSDIYGLDRDGDGWGCE